MASSALQPIINLQLANSEAALFTAPTGYWVQIVKLLATNNDTASHQLTLAVVPSGHSYASAYITTPALSLLSGNTYLGYNEYGLVLAPGDAIYGFADTGAKVSVFATGLYQAGS